MSRSSLSSTSGIKATRASGLASPTSCRQSIIQIYLHQSIKNMPAPVAYRRQRLWPSLTPHPTIDQLFKTHLQSINQKHVSTSGIQAIRASRLASPTSCRQSITQKLSPSHQSKTCQHQWHEDDQGLRPGFIYNLKTIIQKSISNPSIKNVKAPLPYRRPEPLGWLPKHPADNQLIIPIHTPTFLSFSSDIS